MTLDDAVFRKVMGSFASGVTVVTAVHDNMRYGMTVSSFCSVSLDPQLLLVCITKTLPTHHAIINSGVFGVSILAANQAHISQQFASRVADKFAGVDLTMSPQGVPLIAHTCAAIECTVEHQYAGGDHTIFVGRITHAVVNDHEPLAYFRGAYRSLV
jgi:flavin reductase (DIM6/NTAB) family NADH-FMN oxidoreductase RutF